LTKLAIYEGDCLDVLAQLPARSVDCVVCSPPYNLKINYTTYSDNMTDAAYCDFMYRVGAALHRVLKPDGSWFLNIAGTPSKPALPFRVLNILAGNLYRHQNTIHWIKSISIGSHSHGHFKPVNSERFLHSAHEYIFHLTKTGKVALRRLAIGVPYQDISNATRWSHGHTRRCRGNTWFIPYPTVQRKSDKHNHPTIFPNKLPRWCIRLHGRRNAVVLDPFMGSGTTLIAARRERVKLAIGIEIDKNYVATAVSRIQQSGGKVDVRKVVSRTRK